MTGLRLGPCQRSLYSALFVCLRQSYRRRRRCSQTRLSVGITSARSVSRCGTPRIPTAGLTAYVFQQHAVDRTDGQAQLAACAFGFNHGMHAFVRANDGVYRAGVYAQSTAYAPVLVYPNHAARGLHAVIRVKRKIGLRGHHSQAVYAFIAAGRALVDCGLASGDGVRISRAIRVAATRALRLRQYFQDALSQRHCIQAVARRRLPTGADLFLLTVLPVALTEALIAGFFVTAFLVLGWCACMKATISG